MVYITCPCGQVVETFPSRLKRKKYCSKKCFYRFHGRPSGLVYKIRVVNKGWFKKRNGYGLNKKGYKVIYHRGGKWKGQEHRLVMEEYLGRKLRTDEVVHHLNGVKTDNRVINLQVMTKKQHDRLHNGKKI